MHKNSLLLFVVFICVACLSVLPAIAAGSEVVFASKKLLLAMGGVVISAGLIYLVLSFYKRFFHNFKTNQKTTYDENTLLPPVNKDNAVSNFLNRTNI